MLNENLHNSIRDFKLIVITVLIFYICYLLLVFPSILDFFYHNLSSIDYIVANHNIINIGSNIAGSQFFIFSIMELTGLDNLIVSAMPLLLIQYIIILSCIFRKILPDNYFILFVVSLLIPFTGPGSFVMDLHSLGFLLFLTLIIIALMDGKNKYVISILLLLISVSVGFISYKFAAIVIFFLFFLLAFSIINYRLHNEKYTLGSIYILTISLIITIGLNSFFYYAGIKFFRTTEYSDLAIFKIINFKDNTTMVTKSAADILFNPPFLVSYIGIVRNIIIITMMLLVFVIIIHKIYRSRSLLRYEWIYLMLIFSIGSIFLIYFILGILQLFYVFFVGCFGICILYTTHTKYKKAIKILILTILVLGLFSMFLYSSSGYIMGHKSHDGFGYLMSTTSWFGDYHNDNDDSIIKSDVFTAGFFVYNLEKMNERNEGKIIYFDSSDEIVSIINYKPQMENDYPDMIILNNNLKYVATNRWNYVKSLSNLKFEINQNYYFDSIYSSKYLTILSKNIS